MEFSIQVNDVFKKSHNTPVILQNGGTFAVCDGNTQIQDGGALGKLELARRGTGLLMFRHER